MKIRSSKELKESIQNIDRVIENELLDTHVEIDPILADAYEQNKEIELHVEEVFDELNKKAEEVVEENPEAPIPIENNYTKTLKLDESLEDFELDKAIGDGRSRKQSVRGEDEGDVYTDYSMFEFISSLISGKNCNTNPAPITPTVYRRDPKSGEFKYLPMKKFMTQGEDSVSYDGSNVSGTFSEDELDDFEETNATDTVGMYKGTGSPQLGIEDNDFIVYSNSLEDLQQLQQGLAHYGIEYREPKQKTTGHWKRYMKVITPVDLNGDILSLRDWLKKTHRKVEDVMYPDFALRYKERFGKLERQEEIDKVYNKFVTQAAQDSSITLSSVLDSIQRELKLSSNPLNDKELKAIKNRLKNEFSAEESLDSIYDKYVTKAFNDGTLKLTDVFNEMINELRSNFIKFNNKALKDRFMSEFEDDFEDEEEESIPSYTLNEN